MSLEACISRWPSTTRRPWLSYSLGLVTGLQHRGVGLLELQHEVVRGVVLAHEQGDPAPGSDGADAHHLAGGVDDPVAVDEDLEVIRQGLAVLVEDPLHRRADLGLVHPRELADRLHERRVADDLEIPVGPRGGVARHRPGAGLLAALGQGALEGGDARRVDRPGPPAQDVLGLDPGVPDVEPGHGRELGHRVAVLPGDRRDDLAALLGGEPQVPTRHLEAGHQPLHVPLERPGQGLVEVVEVEDQRPLRGGEPAEVGQVRVPGQLHGQPGAAPGCPGRWPSAPLHPGRR